MWLVKGVVVTVLLLLQALVVNGQCTCHYIPDTLEMIIIPSLCGARPLIACSLWHQRREHRVCLFAWRGQL